MQHSVFMHHNKLENCSNSNRKCVSHMYAALKDDGHDPHCVTCLTLCVIKFSVSIYRKHVDLEIGSYGLLASVLQ